ncbi:MAG: hypothetical protein ACMXYC_00895 [Candidatus Woesearchaeota archaeon]
MQHNQKVHTMQRNKHKPFNFFLYIFICCIFTLIHLQHTHALLISPSTIQLGEVLPAQQYPIHLSILGHNIHIHNHCDNTQYTPKKTNVQFNLTIPQYAQPGIQHCNLTITEQQGSITIISNIPIHYNVQTSPNPHMILLTHPMISEYHTPLHIPVTLWNRGNIVEDKQLCSNEHCIRTLIYPQQKKEVILTLPAIINESIQHLSIPIHYGNTTTTSPIQFVPFGTLTYAGTLHVQPICTQGVIHVDIHYNHTGTYQGLATFNIIPQQPTTTSQKKTLHDFTYTTHDNTTDNTPHGTTNTMHASATPIIHHHRIQQGMHHVTIPTLLRCTKQTFLVHLTMQHTTAHAQHVTYTPSLLSGHIIKMIPKQSLQTFIIALCAIILLIGLGIWWYKKT